MNINDLTLGQLKEIQSISLGATPRASSNPVVGKFCIARCYAAGVHAGEVVSVDGENVILKDSVRMWSWKARFGIALSGVAQNGVTDDSTIDTVNPLIYLTGVCELIPCSETAQRSLNVKT